jgi:hypothetical protein
VVPDRCLGEPQTARDHLGGNALGEQPKHLRPCRGVSNTGTARCDGGSR